MSEEVSAAPIEEGETQTPEAAPAVPDVAPEATPAEQTAEADAEPQGVPEQYEAFSVPEGMTLDETLLGKFVPLAKELKLDQAGAQKVIDLYALGMQAQVQAWDKQVNDWSDQVKADPDLGGKNYGATQEAAQKGMSAYGSPELKAFLEQTGLGNHPEMVRLMAKVGKATSEGPFIPSTTPTPNVGDIASRMFPNTK